MKTALSTLAAALIATTSFVGVALAEGDYYDGASKNQAAVTTNGQVDKVTTGSIVDQRVNDRNDNRPIFERKSRDNR